MPQEGKDEKASVVVGAAGGIGIEVVRQLSRQMTVIAVVLNQEQATEARNAGAQTAIECDLGDLSSVEAAIESLGRLLPNNHLHGLVHCAAIQPLGVAELLPLEELRRVFNVNLFGALRLTQGVLPALRAARGRLAFFSSLTAVVPPPMVGAYAMSKCALEGLADVMRRELKPFGVSVSVIEPGGVATPMAAAQASMVERLLETMPPACKPVYERQYQGYVRMATKALRHASEPKDVAAVAVRVVAGNARPKPRYLVGKDAKIMGFLQRLLPTSWMDALLIKVSGGAG